ncbi:MULTISPECIES: hypothetical protein [Citrobacter]|uniref:hypothetical protein n=1 Tax=Citrobacter TaxID=544 RepID=UPI00374CF6DB
MAYLHSRFLMAVTPVVVSVLMATLAMKMFEPRLFVSASEKGWFPLSLFVSIPFLRILIYVNTDSGQYEHPAFPALGSVLF